MVAINAQKVTLWSTGTLIFVGLPLLAWGIGDLAGFFDHSARLLYIIITPPLHAAITFLFAASGSISGAGVKTVQRQHLAIRLLQLFPLALVIVAPYCDRRDLLVIHDADFLRYMGLVLYVGGMCLMQWAVVWLDTQFSMEVTIQKNHRLITNGPYRYIRHPRYLGIIAMVSGLSLIFRSWLGLGLVGAIVLVLMWRIHDEEALMRQEFRDEWDAFCRRTWRLIPPIF